MHISEWVVIVCRSRTTPRGEYTGDSEEWGYSLILLSQAIPNSLGIRLMDVEEVYDGPRPSQGRSEDTERYWFPNKLSWMQCTTQGQYYQNINRRLRFLSDTNREHWYDKLVFDVVQKLPIPSPSRWRISSIRMSFYLNFWTQNWLNCRRYRDLYKYIYLKTWTWGKNWKSTSRPNNVLLKVIINKTAVRVGGIIYN